MSWKTSVAMNASYLIAYSVGATVLGITTALVWPLIAWWWDFADRENALLEGFLRGSLGFLTYIVWGITLLAVIAILRNVARLGSPAGRWPMRSWASTRFYLYNLLLLEARYFFLAFARSTSINLWFYRAMGARIGRHVIINTTQVYDCNLLRIGDHATIGGSAVVMCHIGQGNELYVAPVVIEDGASIGEGAIVFPGARLGARSVIGAGSVVPRDFVVPEGTKWSGVPIKPVGPVSVTSQEA